MPHFWTFFLKAYTRAFTQQNIQSGWKATEIYPFDPEHILVRIIKRKRKSDVQISPSKTPGSTRALRRTYKRLHTENHIDNDAAVLVRAGEKLAAENKILRRKNKGLRGAIFKEKRKRKRKKTLNFYNEGEQEGQALFFNSAKVARARRHRRRVGSGLPKGGLNPPVAGNGLGIPPLTHPENPAGLRPGTHRVLLSYL